MSGYCYAPCLCGADDCERCHPGSTRVVKCRRCGVLAQLCDTSDWDIDSFADDGICEDCIEKRVADGVAGGDGKESEA